MNCSTVQELLICYLDGDLSSGEEVDVKSHLDTCWECREELEAVRGLLGTVSSVFSTICVRTDWEGLSARMETETCVRPVPRRKVRKEFMTIFLTPARLLVSATAVVAVVAHVAVFISGSGMDAVEEEPCDSLVQLAACDDTLEFNLDGNQPPMTRRVNEIKAVLAGVDVFETRVAASSEPVEASRETGFPEDGSAEAVAGGLASAHGEVVVDA